MTLPRNVVVQLTPRDRKILETLANLRALETDQIAWLFFENRETARQRLVRLREVGLIAFTRQFENLRCPKGYWILKNRPCPSVFLADHQIGLNWVYCRLIGHGNGMSPPFSWEDGETFVLANERDRIRPDARIRRTTPGAIVLFEYDRGTKSLPVITQNVRAYWKWAQGEKTGDRILLLYGTPTPNRRDQIRRIFEESFDWAERFFGVGTAARTLERFRFASILTEEANERIQEALQPAEPSKPRVIFPEVMKSRVPPHIQEQIARDLQRRQEREAKGL